MTFIFFQWFCYLLWFARTPCKTLPMFTNVGLSTFQVRPAFLDKNNFKFCFNCITVLEISLNVMSNCFSDGSFVAILQEQCIEIRLVIFMLKSIVLYLKKLFQNEYQNNYCIA